MFLWETMIIHLQQKQSKDVNIEADGGFYYAGMCIPVSNKFYKDADLTNTKLILLQQSPFSLTNIKRSGDDVLKTYHQHQELINNNIPHGTCLVDGIVAPMVMSVWRDCLDHITSLVPPYLFKYPGCWSCGQEESHVTYPWAPYLQLPSRFKTAAYSRTTYTTLLKKWASLAEEHPNVRKLHIYMMVSSLTSAYKLHISQKTQLMVQELGNMNSNIQWPEKIFEILGMERLSKIPSSPNEEFFIIEKHNQGDHLRQELGIMHYKKRKIYLSNTNVLTVDNPYKEEIDKTWIPSKSRQRQSNDTKKNKLQSYTTEIDMNKPLFKVKSNYFI